MKGFRMTKKHDENYVSEPDSDIQVSAREIIKNREKKSADKEYLPQTIFGIRFPWEVYFFVIIGALSEVVDALFMVATLSKIGTDLSPIVAIIISAVIGAGCFFSMAFAGFQLGNRRYYTKMGMAFSYIFWASAGVALVAAKLFAGMIDGGLSSVMSGDMSLGEMIGSQEFIQYFIVAVVQLILYIGTGFMTRDSVRILTDNDIREYQLAKREYDELLDELAEKRKDITEDISKLKSYPKIAERLIASKRSVMRNVKQYNEAARAIIEAKMSVSVQPELMEAMYDSAMKKEKENEK